MSSRLHDPGHPLWSIARMIVFVAALYVMSSWAAENFDTEIYVVLGMLLVISGVEGAGVLLKRFGGSGGL